MLGDVGKRGDHSVDFFDRVIVAEADADEPSGVRKIESAERLDRVEMARPDEDAACRQRARHIGGGHARDGQREGRDAAFAGRRTDKPDRIAPRDAREKAVAEFALISFAAVDRGAQAAGAVGCPIRR